MELADLAVLQTVLEGVALPATNAELVGYAVVQGAKPAQLELLARLPDEEFVSIDAVAECLLSVQPEYADEVPHEPKEESGLPPGGDEYASPSQVSGFVPRLTTGGLTAGGSHRYESALSL